VVELAFRLVNVFTSGAERLSGNPLCVFEDGSALTDDAMQAIARQFNLSETTFLLRPSTVGAAARVRIFTPSFEMPFAGHPTLGTAHVARSLLGCGDRVVLEMKAGRVPVTGERDQWTLQAAHGPETRAPAASRAELAAMLRLPMSSLGEAPLWVDTGSEQLVVPLASPADVRAARPDAELVARHGVASGGNALVYVWARESTGEIVVRFFFFVAGGLVEDPATGSACANLGGWMIATKAALPFYAVVRQGDAVKRPSVLSLSVNEREEIFVGGQVVDVGRGTITI
jgi:PhzF family phenazine biosynthesis protein